jgi:hypothetical protein
VIHIIARNDFVPGHEQRSLRATWVKDTTVQPGNARFICTDKAPGPHFQKAENYGHLAKAGQTFNYHVTDLATIDEGDRVATLKMSAAPALFALPACSRTTMLLFTDGKDFNPDGPRYRAAAIGPDMFNQTFSDSPSSKSQAHGAGPMTSTSKWFSFCSGKVRERIPFTILKHSQIASTAHRLRGGRSWVRCWNRPWTEGCHVKCKIKGATMATDSAAMWV